MVVIASPLNTTLIKDDRNKAEDNDNVQIVNTKFTIAYVLKGDKSTQNVLLQHFQLIDEKKWSQKHDPVQFDQTTVKEDKTRKELTKNEYMLFVKYDKEKKIYLPVSGLKDSGASAKVVISMRTP